MIGEHGEMAQRTIAKCCFDSRQPQACCLCSYQIYTHLNVPWLTTLTCMHGAVITGGNSRTKPICQNPQFCMLLDVGVDVGDFHRSAFNKRPHRIEQSIVQIMSTRVSDNRLKQMHHDKAERVKKGIDRLERQSSYKTTLLSSCLRVFHTSNPM